MMHASDRDRRRPSEERAEFEAWARGQGRPFHGYTDEGREWYSFAAMRAWLEGRDALRRAAIALLIESRVSGASDAPAGGPPEDPPHTAANWPAERRESPTPSELVGEWHRPTVTPPD